LNAGPLSPFSCFCLFIIRKAILIQVLLFLNAISIARYILIFCLKNPAALKDDFWYIFISLWAVIFSPILPLIRAYVPGNQLLEYYICTGEDPTEILNLPSFARGYTDLASILIQLAIHIRITVYKKQQQKNVEPPTRSSFLKSLTLSDLEIRSLSNFSTNFWSVVFLALGVVMITLSNFKRSEDFLKYPKYLFIYYTYLVFPSLVCIALIFLYFTKNEPLRQTISRELREKLF
jgi:hypothetical protein